MPTTTTVLCPLLVGKQYQYLSERDRECQIAGVREQYIAIHKGPCDKGSICQPPLQYPDSAKAEASDWQENQRDQMRGSKHAKPRPCA